MGTVRCTQLHIHKIGPRVVSQLSCSINMLFSKATISSLDSNYNIEVPVLRVSWVHYHSTGDTRPWRPGFLACVYCFYGIDDIRETSNVISDSSSFTSGVRTSAHFDLSRESCRGSDCIGTDTNCQHLSIQHAPLESP